jgi:hypothetical protein
VSFSSLQAGHGTSAGAIIYPFRELERDALERELQRQLDSWQNGHDPSLSDEPIEPDDDFVEWLRSEDSPLLLLNVSEFVIDPEAHLREIAARVEGTDRPSPHLVGPELAGESRRERQEQRAGELKTRLKTFAELDSERVGGAPRRRGTPKGKTRTFYSLLVSPPRDLPNAEFKRLILEVIRRRWPGAIIAGYVHRDTDNTHLHIWISAETLSGKKIDVKRETPSGDAVLDKYPDLDEQVARAFSRHFNDPSIYDEHIAKKLEWVYWRERFEEALRRGERPPIMPHRARHDYDWLGERRAISNREESESRSHSSEREHAAPVPRAKSLMGALELWGKTIHLDARVRYRRALLDTLDLWRDGIEYPVEGVKRSLERELEEAERDYARYKEAFVRTLENRESEGYPRLKFPLHNAKQIAEMREIARLTRDADLLRYMHEYEVLDRPSGPERLGREVGMRWRDEILARLEAAERGEQLIRVAFGEAAVADDGRGTLRGAGAPGHDRDAEIVRGWLGGSWRPEQMRSSLGCLADDSTRYHAERYVRACEYHEAARSALADFRVGADQLAVPPPLDRDDRASIEIFLARDSRAGGSRDHDYWREVAAYAAGEREVSHEAMRRLPDHPIDHDGQSFDLVARDRRDDLGPLRPNDDRWAGRLRSLAELRELEAAAAALDGTSEERFERARARAASLQDTLELTRAVRCAAGLAPDASPCVLSAEEERARAGAERIVSERLRTRGGSWESWQINAVREASHALPASQSRLAERVAGRAQARLEAGRIAEEREALSSQLDVAARSFVAGVARTDGLEALLDSRLREWHVTGLTDRFVRVAIDEGHSLDRLGLCEEHLRVRAISAFGEEVARLEREEREAHGLARLEAEMVLAEARSDVAATERECFAAHAYFRRWGYTVEERWVETSLAETMIAIGEASDPALRLVALDEERHVVPAINVEHERLLAAERERAAEAASASARYDAAASGRAGIGSRPPAFTAEELSHLEECAAATRDTELAAVVSRCEEALSGAEYAARRALGRAFAAGVVEDAERSLEAKYEYPFDPDRHPLLPPSARHELTGALARHRTAREAECSSATTYHSAWRACAEDLKVLLTPEGRARIVPLLSQAEAGRTYANMGERERVRIRLSRGQAEVMSEQPAQGRAGGPSRQDLAEWAAGRPGAMVPRSREYLSGLGDVNIRSYGAAQRELDRARPTRSRGK